MSTDHSSGLLLGFQLEIPYALVGSGSLDPLARADELLSLLCGERLRRVEHDEVVFENRGPRHSLRIASREGFDTLAGAAEVLSRHLEKLAALASEIEGRLLPTGMHPWLQADRAETWPHGASPRSAALQALFGRGRHGWANQQGLALSLPFTSESQFFGLVTALRFAMPLMPALAASSPFVEGRVGPARSCRLAAYRDYVGTQFVARRGASFVPPSFTSPQAYRAAFDEPVARRLSAEEHSIAVHEVSPYGLYVDLPREQVVLRMLDTQECLQADLALVAFVAATAGYLIHESPLLTTDSWPSARVADLLEVSLIEAETGVIRDRGFLEIFEFPERGACRYRDLLQYLIEERLAEDPAIAGHREALSLMVERGSLSTRLLSALPERFDDEALFGLYQQVASCLRENQLLAPDAA